MIKVIMSVWNRQSFRWRPDFGSGTTRKPDCMIRPKQHLRPLPAQAADSIGGPNPTMVAEVGLTRSLSDLHRTAALFYPANHNLDCVDH
jgi:hypothetical protein